MRKIGIVFAAFLVLTVILSACADRNSKLKKTSTEEAAPTVPLLEQDKPLFSSEEQSPTDPAQGQAVPGTESPSASSTDPKGEHLPEKEPDPPLGTTASAPTSTVPKTSRVPNDPPEQGALELPDHNWR